MLVQDISAEAHNEILDWQAGLSVCAKGGLFFLIRMTEIDSLYLKQLINVTVFLYRQKIKGWQDQKRRGRAGCFWQMAFILTRHLTLESLRSLLLRGGGRGTGGAQDMWSRESRTDNQHRPGLRLRSDSWSHLPTSNHKFKPTHSLHTSAMLANSAENWQLQLRDSAARRLKGKVRGRGLSAS